MNTASRKTETVILVHGLWMTSLVMRPLARRLRDCGFHPVLFTYPSLRHTLHANARALANKVAQQSTARVHLVGHSLGGLVILQALLDNPELVSGRIVLLGSPVNGSVVAQRLYRHRLSRWLIGRGSGERLANGGSQWQGTQQLGVIAGTLSVGTGRILGSYEGPGDGTVRLAETELAGCTDSLQVRATHSGLVVSRAVARAVCRFLEDGRFCANPGIPGRAGPAPHRE